MTNSDELPPSLDEAQRQKLVDEARSEAGQQTLSKIRAADAKQLSPELCNAVDLQYAAYKTPYVTPDNAPVLTLLAQGLYYPTPVTVEMFFEAVYGKPNEYKLMQVRSDIVFFLATYHSASYSSGAGLLDLRDVIVIEDAFGRHEVRVQTWS